MGIKGRLNSTAHISGKLTEKGTLTGRITVPEIVEIGQNPYTGAYAVTPRVYEQTLDTSGKSMDDDVKVYEIPVTWTSNPQGGQTVLIG